MTTDTTPEVTATPTLPGLELPEYHGRKPAGMLSSVSGSSNRTTRAHEIGSRVVFVVEARVKSSGHLENDNGLQYAEKYAVVDMWELDSQQGSRLVSAVKTAHRAGTDGEEPLDLEGKGDVVRTDGSGVVVTPGDAATLAGDDFVASLTDEARTPAVVVYSDGARELWPDEFDATDPRPAVGTVVLDEDGQPSVVKELLHGDTGETIEAITEAEIDAALLAYEEKLLAAEQAEALEGAIEDRKVHEEITAHLEEGAVGDPTPVDQVDPPEADGAGDGPEAEPFPDGPAEISHAGDGPDGEVEFVVDDDGFADVVPDPEPAAPAYGPEDSLAVDRDLLDLREFVAAENDRATLLRWLAAEEDGRGRGLKPRKGALEAIAKRAAALFSDLDEVGAPDLPVDGFEPGADALDEEPEA